MKANKGGHDISSEKQVTLSVSCVNWFCAAASPAGRICRFMVGLILLGFGLWQIRGQSLNFVWLNHLLQPLWHMQTRWQRKSTALGYGLYGFGYILAGFG
jgi:hypothetical protein